MLCHPFFLLRVSWSNPRNGESWDGDSISSLSYLLFSNAPMGLEALLELQGQQWAADMIGVSLAVEAAVDRAIQQRRDSFPTEILRRLEKRYDNAIATGKKANPPPE